MNTENTPLIIVAPPLLDAPKAMAYVEKSVALHKQILAYDYYQGLYQGVLQKYGVAEGTEACIKLMDPGTLCLLWNDFWAALPDNGAIRRAPFFQLCDLAEDIFDSDNG